MRFWGVLAMLWLGLCALAPVYAASAADAVLAEVTAALAAGQYEDAVTVAASGVAEPGLGDLTRSRLLIVRGLARQALGANDDALSDFTQGLSIAALPAQERAKALFARGVTLDSLGRLEDAAGDYDAVLRLSPGATYALNNRANVRRRQGHLDEAQRDYLAALKSANPNPQYPYFGLGQIAEAEGDIDAARAYYNKALAAAPGFALALERLQALGTPVEGSAGLPADTGVILLKPPPAAPAIALHPPAPKPPAAPPAPGFSVAAARGAAVWPAPLSGNEAPLRPSIAQGVEGRPLAQLGAWRSEQKARDGWTLARGSAGGLLDGLSPLITRAEIPGRGAYWRLRTAPQQPVAQFCAALTQRGLACIPARD
jgi:tetratricopeptide (TPR) repeat protein